MRQGRAEDLPAQQIPADDLPVVASGNQRTAVGADSDGGDPCRGSQGFLTDRLPRRRIPPAKQALGVAREQVPATIGEGDGSDGCDAGGRSA